MATESAVVQPTRRINRGRSSPAVLSTTEKEKRHNEKRRSWKSTVRASCVRILHVRDGKKKKKTLQHANQLASSTGSTNDDTSTASKPLSPLPPEQPQMKLAVAAYKDSSLGPRSPICAEKRRKWRASVHESLNRSLDFSAADLSLDGTLDTCSMTDASSQFLNLSSSDFLSSPRRSSLQRNYSGGLQRSGNSITANVTSSPQRFSSTPLKSPLQRSYSCGLPQRSKHDIGGDAIITAKTASSPQRFSTTPVPFYSPRKLVRQKKKEPKKKRKKTAVSSGKSGGLELKESSASLLTKHGKGIDNNGTDLSSMVTATAEDATTNSRRDEENRSGGSKRATPSKLSSSRRLLLPTTNTKKNKKFSVALDYLERKYRFLLRQHASSETLSHPHLQPESSRQFKRPDVGATKQQQNKHHEKHQVSPESPKISEDSTSHSNRMDIKEEKKPDASLHPEAIMALSRQEDEKPIQSVGKTKKAPDRSSSDRFVDLLDSKKSRERSYSESKKLNPGIPSRQTDRQDNTDSIISNNISQRGSSEGENLDGNTSGLDVPERVASPNSRLAQLRERKRRLERRHSSKSLLSVEENPTNNNDSADDGQNTKSAEPTSAGNDGPIALLDESICAADIFSYHKEKEEEEVCMAGSTTASSTHSGDESESKIESPMEQEEAVVTKPSVGTADKAISRGNASITTMDLLQEEEKQAVDIASGTSSAGLNSEKLMESMAESMHLSGLIEALEGDQLCVSRAAAIADAPTYQMPLRIEEEGTTQIDALHKEDGKVIRFACHVEARDIPLLEDMSTFSLFYSSGEIAEFRYQAFMEEAGLKPGDFA